MEALKKANALNGELQHELAKCGGECFYLWLLKPIDSHLNLRQKL